MKSRQFLAESLNWGVAGQISDSTCDILLQAVNKINSWLDASANSDYTPVARLLKAIGGVSCKPSSAIWKRLGFHHVEFSTIFIDPLTITWETTVHEFAHILDNSLGAHPLAAIFGGGPADEMARFVGYEPDQFFPRFHAAGFEQRLKDWQIEPNPTDYGRQAGPAEDFAETFRLMVTDGEFLKRTAPQRFAWFNMWKSTILFKITTR